MKLHQTIAALCVTLLASQLATAKTITVDNKVGSVAMYTSLQQACHEALAGDTILIAGSQTSYGHADIRKQLHLVGPGYWLAENNIAGITKDTARFTVAFGEVELSSSNGSSATGVYLDSLGYATPNVGTFYFDKCVIISSNLTSRVHIEQSFLGGVTLQVSGSAISNCLIGGGGGPNLKNGTTASNCVIQFAHVFSSDPGSSISSSIFVAPSGLTASAFAANAKGSVTHCLAVGGVGYGGNPTFLPTGNGNLPTIAFTVQTFALGQSPDKAYTLAPNSPALGTGLNGVDMGIFGGVLPYVISGVPSLPRITRFLVPSTATSASGLHIEMDAESF